MADSLENPFRRRGLPEADIYPSVDADAVAELLRLCPAHSETPIRESPDLAARVGVAHLYLKDERDRMGLGSFKALGAAYAIATDAAAATDDNWDHALSGITYATASAGNHGLSVAAGARLFGAQAAIYLSETVPEAFARRLRRAGARVVRRGADYEASMDAAAEDAERHGFRLLSDSSWPGYTERPLKVMEGYLQLAAEAGRQMPQSPTHILLQAGVGGLAAAVAAHARVVWGDTPRVVVVEPEAAPALTESIRAGRLVTAAGPTSAMGRLDCKTPSLIALNGLARDADLFVTVSEAEAERAVQELAAAGFATTPSGGAGIAALIAGRAGCDAGARVLAILSEGPEDG